MLTLKRYQWQFSARAWSSLVTLLLFPFFVYLGFWQLQRFEFKHSLEKTQELALQAKPISFEEFQKNAIITKLLNNHFSNITSAEEEILKHFRYRSLSLVGKFLNDNNILLDNQILNGQPGYRVITPFQVHSHADSYVDPDLNSHLNSQMQSKNNAEKPFLLLVDRGFIPWGESRKHLPTINSILEVVNIKGMVTQLRSGILLQESPKLTKITWPLQIQNIDYAELAEKLQHKVYPFLLQLEPSNHHYGYQPMPINFGLKKERHLGYAVQWFTMAIAVLLYYWFVHIKSRVKKPTDNKFKESNNLRDSSI